MGDQTARKVAQAFIEGKRMTCGNYESTGTQFLLFGNEIATKYEDEFYIKDCGWYSATTSRTLNTLPGVRLKRLHGEWIWNEKEKWNGQSKFIEYKS